MWGPYFEADEGIYDVTFSYEIERKGDGESWFDISVDEGKRTIASCVLIENNNTVTLENVHIMQGEKIEYRVWACKDAIIKVNKVMIVRK